MIDGERWPDFKDGRTWHDIKLLRKKNDPHEDLGYPAQVSALKPIFQAHGINIKNVTHAGRKAACQYGEAIDIPDAQLRQMGHWDSSKMAVHYSAGIAKTAARMFAGHGKERGNYFLEREALDPPGELRKQIFPHLEESLQHIQSGGEDRAAEAFLTACDWFRTVLLQDATELMTTYPNLRFWSYAPFNTDSFRQYRVKLMSMKATDPHSAAMQVQKVVPQIASEIRSLGQTMFQSLSVLENNQKDQSTHMRNQLEDCMKRLRPIESLCQQMLNGDIPSTTRFHFNLEGQGGPRPTEHDSQPHISITSTAEPTAPGSLQALSSESNASADDENSACPTACHYEMDSNVKTVIEAWKEWTIGLDDPVTQVRMPSIQYLEDNFKTRWRQRDKIRKRFTRRRVIMDFVEKVARFLEVPELAAANKMEFWRAAKKISLDKLSKDLQGNGNLFGENFIELRDINM